jgi:predicted ferric reductase
MAAGGIGITPILGMLKDAYDIGLTEDQARTACPHAIDTIYLLWVMPHVEDATCFWEELEMCVAASKSAHMPNLVLMIYVTRAKDKLKPPFASGRPNIENIFKILNSHGTEHASLVFACGPQAMVSELWDKSVQHTMKGRLIDFHHEIFEF